MHHVLRISAVAQNAVLRCSTSDFCIRCTTFPQHYVKACIFSADWHTDTVPDAAVPLPYAKNRAEILMFGQNLPQILCIFTWNHNQCRIFICHIIAGKPFVLENTHNCIPVHNDLCKCKLPDHRSLLNQIPFHHLVLFSGKPFSPFFYLLKHSCLTAPCLRPRTAETLYDLP